MDTLPQELADRIFDFSHDDLPTLKHCSLVSKRWRFSCGHHLFRSLTLNPSNALDVLAFSMANNNDTIFSRVKRLKVSEEQLPLLSIPWVVDASTALHHFSSVTCLCLHGIVWREPVSLISLTGGFPYLRELEIDNIVVHSMDILLQAIVGFLSLDRLSLRGIGCLVKPKFFHALSLEGRPCIHRLEFLEDTQDIFLNWLACFGALSMANVTSLRVGAIKKHLLPSFGDVIRTLGASLERLEIGFNMLGGQSVKKGETKLNFSFFLFSV